MLLPVSPATQNTFYYRNMNSYSEIQGDLSTYFDNEKHAEKTLPIFRWSTAHDSNIKEYGKCSAVHLDRIHSSDSCTCTNTNCSIGQHISDIDYVFNDNVTRASDV